MASAYSVRPLPDARVSTPLSWDEVPTVEAEAFTLATVPARYAAIGDPGAGIDEAVGSLEALLELSRQHEAEGQGDAPWPPNYAKQAGEPPRVQPSKARVKPTEYEPGRGEDGGPPPEVAAERAAAVAAGDPNAGLPTEWAGSRPTPTGRRKTPIPVIEIARAAKKAEALEGLERWKATPSGRGRRARTGGRPRRRDARPLVALVSRPGEPDPRPGGGPAGAGAARGRLRPVGRVRVARPAPASSSGRRGSAPPRPRSRRRTRDRAVELRPPERAASLPPASPWSASSPPARPVVPRPDRPPSRRPPRRHRPVPRRPHRSNRSRIPPRGSRRASSRSWTRRPRLPVRAVGRHLLLGTPASGRPPPARSPARTST